MTTASDTSTSTELSTDNSTEDSKQQQQRSSKDEEIDQLISNFEGLKLENPELTQEEMAATAFLEEECKKISASTMKDLTRTSTIHHVIKVKNNKPIRCKIRPIPQAKRAEFKAMLQDMIDLKMIVPSKSECRSGINLVAKKDGSTRMTLDYRDVNEITEKDTYPLPNTNTMFTQLANASYFSKLDLHSGYYQVPMDPDSQKYTAFGCEFGLFEYTVMPMGLTNATATFQRLMNTVLEDLIGVICLVYLDDIIVYTDKSLKHHIESVLKVFERLKQHNLKVKLKKCEFVKRIIIFLGHTISNGQIMPNNDKIETLLRYPRPVSVTQVQSFLGLATYYRKFIKGFSMIAAPLYAATTEKKLIWTDACQIAFDKLRTILTSDTVFYRTLTKILY